jgi:hypothetical protein
MVGLTNVFRFILILACAGPLFAGLRAGAAKVAITPDLGRPVYIAGFGQNRLATGVHDELYARCVALDTGARPLVVCAADLIGFFLDDTDAVRAIVRAKLPAIDPEVVVAATHVHEGPDTMGLWGPARGVSGIDGRYNRRAVERIAEAAVQSVRALAPASASLATISSPELDSFIDDDRPPVTHDSALTILRLTAANGRAIATVVNWAYHPETTGSRNTLITADYPAALCAELEKRNGGIAAFWNGAVGGMQSPLNAKVTDPATRVPAPDNTFRKAEIIGTRVAALAASARFTPAAIDHVFFRREMVRIPVSNPQFLAAQKADLFKGRNRTTADGALAVPVGYASLSSAGKPLLEIAFIPGELYPELSTGAVVRYPEADFPGAPIEPALKPSMTAPFRMVLGLADDEIGYIIPNAEWDEKAPYLNGAPKPWYGEVNSPGPEAAVCILSAFEDLLKTRPSPTAARSKPSASAPSPQSPPR